MRRRGWTPVPLAVRDYDTGVARREFGQAVLRAEFFFDPASHDDYDIDDNGLYTYCVSDQVRFFAFADSAAVPLAEVPPLVFSEAMRDVDLFIGVTSIGTDPEWLDRGEGRRFGQYWHQWGFGALSAPAQVRREVLAQLVPKLAIADRCTLEDRYLVVRGDLRTYRIHLGSGNILMSPDDQGLSLILSKAFLLAADEKITDPLITSQIRLREAGR
jgi:hypothetical protein